MLVFSAFLIFFSLPPYNLPSFSSKGPLVSCLPQLSGFSLWGKHIIVIFGFLIFHNGFSFLLSFRFTESHMQVQNNLVISTSYSFSFLRNSKNTSQKGSYLTCTVFWGKLLKSDEEWSPVTLALATLPTTK